MCRASLQQSMNDAPTSDGQGFIIDRKQRRVNTKMVSGHTALPFKLPCWKSRAGADASHRSSPCKLCEQKVKSTRKSSQRQNELHGPAHSYRGMNNSKALQNVAGVKGRGIASLYTCIYLDDDMTWRDLWKDIGKPGEWALMAPFTPESLEGNYPYGGLPQENILQHIRTHGAERPCTKANSALDDLNIHYCLFLFSTHKFLSWVVGIGVMLASLHLLQKGRSIGGHLSNTVPSGNVPLLISRGFFTSELTF